MKTWLVNSNSNPNNNNPNGFKQMIRQNKVAAFYQKSEAIDPIEVNDLIILYHNDNRIIAVGAVVNKGIQDFKDQEIVEHFVDVNWLWKATFDTEFVPQNPIDRRLVGIVSVRRAVENVTNEINLSALLTQIASRQVYL